MRRISTRTHGVLDFLTVGFALTFPRVLGCSERFTNAVTGLALGKLGYALLTRHELGAVKAIPMPAHLTMDAIGGAGMCALPFILDEDDPAAIACAVGMGLFDIAAAPLTEMTPSFDRARVGETRDANPPALPREVHVPETTDALDVRGPGEVTRTPSHHDVPPYTATLA